MKGILPDINVMGHWGRLLDLLHVEPWRLFWDALGLAEVTFAALGLPSTIPDADLWHLCQQRQLVLLTGNRNLEGPDSLEATIRTQNTPDALPVLTIATVNKVLTSPDYAHRVIERLLRYLLEIDSVRGTGRLYLP